MGKVIWCSLAAGMLAAGSLLSLTYYACCCPDSVVGRSMQVIAEASIAMRPLSGLTSMAMRTNHTCAPATETATPLDERIPDDPQPIASERQEVASLAQKEEGFISGLTAVEQEPAPIVIREDDPMPGEVVAPAPRTSIVLNEHNFEMAEMQGQEVPPKGGPTPMPYCRDDEDEPATPPKMPRAEGDAGMEQNVFKAWIDLFREGNKEKAPEVEELPPPVEEGPQAEPKCQEDSHLHEQYPGCPHTSCPFSGKDRMEKYYKRVWDLNSKLKKKGSEESSEEPPHSGEKPHPSKDCKDKEGCPRTKGVDTMEYRKSDAGIDEYGPGPVH
jgi:hypothetical protein